MSSCINYRLPNLSKRIVSAELMDDLAANEKLLNITMRDFIGINRFVARARHVLRTTIIADMRRRQVREVSILDVAAGGCDIGLWFARYCRCHKIKYSVYCLDYDQRALRYARSVCRSESSIYFIETDARDIAKLDLKVDYAFSNHFLHHLPDNDIPAMLRAISACGRHGFVITDLERHLSWYLAFTVLGAIVWRKGYTLADGRMSIQRGFKRKELERYAAQAGIDVSIDRVGFGHWRITNISR